MSHNSATSIPEGATELADPKVLMEAMMSEIRRVMRLELEQVHERIDQMENIHVEQPQNIPNARRRERVQPREVRFEDEENYGPGFVEEDDEIQLLVIGDMQGILEKLGIGKTITWVVLR
ncbi:hypothetical protein CDL15_Pgr026284 [Punica granatum]|nr:hypothetical protein CDL15_Pgr026284 [Punica granatum]